MSNQKRPRRFDHDMRMRKKKNLNERLAAVSDILIMPQNDDRHFGSHGDSSDLIDFENLFGNNNPAHIEIGCGKGQFIRTLAEREPGINFLAVEKLPNVIVAACEELYNINGRRQDGGGQNLPNLRYLCIGAEYLPRYIPKKSVSRIYLNFSCPYPKESYASHRLTSPNMLKRHKELLAEGAEIYQKTDNTRFFEYSIEQLSLAGFLIKNVSLDLHHSAFEGNIITEYESRFSSQGLPIYRLEAILVNK